MKFYGVQLGCTKLFKATDDSEVLTITTFSESSTDRSMKALSKYAKKIMLEGEYESIRSHDPDLTKIAPTLGENSFWSHHTYHYLIDLKDLNKIKEVLDIVFPKKYYIQLKENG